MKLSNINTSALKKSLGRGSYGVKKGFRLFKSIKGALFAVTLTAASVVGIKSLGLGQSHIRVNTSLPVELAKDLSSVKLPEEKTNSEANNAQSPVVEKENFEEKEEPIKILADKLEANELAMHNKQITIEEKEEELSQEQGQIPSSDVYVSEEGSAWVSEEDYQEASNAGIAEAEEGTEVVEVEDAYVDSEGEVWVSEKEANEYANAENKVEDDDCYIDDNGIVWASKEDADSYAALEKNDKGEVVEDNQGYIAPDGEVWVSEDEYLAYKASVAAKEDDNNTASSQDSMYQAEDGSYWASEKDYKDSINGSKNNSSNGKESYDVNDVYVDPEGNYWTSKKEYENYVKSISKTTEEDEIETYSMTEDSLDLENMYQAEDGSVWTDEQFYTNSVMDAQDEVSKTR